MCSPLLRCLWHWVVGFYGRRRRNHEKLSCSISRCKCDWFKRRFKTSWRGVWASQSSAIASADLLGRSFPEALCSDKQSGANCLQQPDSSSAVWSLGTIEKLATRCDELLKAITIKAESHCYWLFTCLSSKHAALCRSREPHFFDIFLGKWKMAAVIYSFIFKNMLT